MFAKKKRSFQIQQAENSSPSSQRLFVDRPSHS